MLSKTVRAAQNIRKLGYKQREIIGIVAGNHQDLAPIVYATLCLGCPINSLGPTLSKGEIIHMLKMTKPTLMFCAVETYDLVSDCLLELGNGATIFTFGGQTNNSEAVDDLFAESGSEDDFV